MDDAAAALRLIRETFKTFCFADAETIEAAAGGVATVDTCKAAGQGRVLFLGRIADGGLPAEPAPRPGRVVAGGARCRALALARVCSPAASALLPSGGSRTP